MIRSSLRSCGRCPSSSRPAPQWPAAANATLTRGLAMRPFTSNRSVLPSGTSRPNRGRALTVAPAAVLGFLSRKLSEVLGGGSPNASSSSASSGWSPSPNRDAANRRVSKSGYDITPLTEAERSMAAQPLSKMALYVALSHGTESPFSGKTVNGVPHDSKAKGTYVCALGGLPLFSSSSKFESGTGWPSFFAPIDPEHILEVTDSSIPYMTRVEVLDRRSGAHLGHVFDDGPFPTGKRYCINSAVLKFIPEGEPIPDQES